MIQGVDIERLRSWMDDLGLGTGPIVDATSLGGGTQNILLRFRRNGDGFVLRRPPLNKREDSDQAMQREASILAALGATSVPHPRLLATCVDPAVIGASFFLMEPVDGINPTVALTGGYLDDRGWRRHLGLAMADTAAAIAALDHVELGLAHLGRPDGYLERQVPRWRAKLDSYQELRGYDRAGIPDLDLVADWLERNCPNTYTPGLLHGDFHLGNVLASPDAPGIAAVLDWELGSVGDPLVDLGWLLATWPDDAGRAPVPLEPRPWLGFPSAAELVRRYAERSTRDLSAVAWYEVLACYRLGILLEGTYARSCAGLAPKDVGQALHDSTLRLFTRATSRIGAA